MSQENVEIVKRGFMALVEDDWPTALATLHPDEVLHPDDLSAIESIDDGEPPRKPSWPR
jgi:hypothetical protein